MDWVQQIERQLSDQLDRSSARSSVRSRVSRHSKSSNTSSRKLALANENARLAELLAEKAMFFKSQEVKQLQLDIDIAKAQARSEAYKDIENDEQKQVQVQPKQEQVVQEEPKQEPVVQVPTVQEQPKQQEIKKEPVKEIKSEVTPQQTVFNPHQKKTKMQKDEEASANLTQPKEDGTKNERKKPETKSDSAPPENDSASRVPAVSLNPQAQAFNPMYQFQYPMMSPQMQEQTDLIIQTHKQMFLPSPEVAKFKGDPIEYIPFIMAFEARIIPHITDHANRLYYLDQHLEGEPKDLIGGCMFMNDGYPEARQLLHQEYGDPYKISAAYVNKALEWPAVRSEDNHGLRSMSYFLTKCYSAMQSISHMSVLNHAPNMQALVQKLPVYLQNKWRDSASRIRKQTVNHQSASFKDLVDFIVCAAESANDPIYGKEALGKNQVKHILLKQQKQKQSSFVTNVTPTLVNQKLCTLCKKQHDLDDCAEFVRKSIEDKRAFIMEKRMCFGCYGFNHTSKGCLQKRICKTCGKRHPTAFHVQNFQFKTPSELQNAQTDNQGNTVSSGMISTSTCYTVSEGSLNVVFQAILPVKVRQGSSGKTIDTYALYDNGSTGCFITDHLKAELNATSTKSNLKLRTMHGVEFVETSSITDLIVTDFNDNNPVNLPRAYSREEIPVSHDQIPKPEVLKCMPHLQAIANKIPPYFPHLDIGLLIGSNCPSALQPLKVIPTEGQGPFAALYRHGWTINGPLHVMYEPKKQSVTCNRIIFNEVVSINESIQPQAILRMFELDFSEQDIGKVPGEHGYSQEDRKFLKIAQKGMRSVDGHYELLLPFRDPNLPLPNNRQQAVARIAWQKKKMQRNEQYHKDYSAFMNQLILKGYAYKVPGDQLEPQPGRVWYLPHHGVYHPKKKDKIRVVFDCSAKFESSSINDKLLQGPDLTNSLIGVLTRFRQEQVAFMGDIEAMFYQVKVPQHQHDLLRFLWWEDGDLQAKLEEYRMSVHIFGAASSPSVSNYALKAMADKAEEKYGPEVADTIRKNFYVDDCLKAVKDEDTAIALIKDLTDACSDGGFRLTKFTCNSSKVLKSIPKEECSKGIQALDLDYEHTLTERALGTQWCTGTDSFGFSVTLSEKPHTRRGILSVIASVYDPLGFVAPFILPAKKMLQELCQEEQLGWDDEISDDFKQRWLKWINQLSDIEEVYVERCLKPQNFGKVISKQLHVFSDASTVGYGAAAYIRLCNDKEKWHTAFLLGKARLAPCKVRTIPQLELTAATVSVNIGQLLLKELDIEFDRVTYHTDSTTVLHYINSEKKRFPVFVTNRVKLIRDFTQPSQWRYVNTKCNPADCASRGMEGKQLVEDSAWLKGPEFLRQPESEWTEQPSFVRESDEECEVVFTTSVECGNDMVDTLIEHYSSWYRLKRAVAIFRRVFGILLKRKQKQKVDCNKVFSVQELKNAEFAIIRYTQSTVFKKEVDCLQDSDVSEVENKRGRAERNQRRLAKNSSIYRLDLFMDAEKGIIRVGGRLSRANIMEEMKYPILLPYKSHVTTLIVRHIHQQLGHSGRNHVLSKLREKYWVINANSAVRSCISHCVGCRRLRLPVSEQMMADLPLDRVEPSPPFTNTGVDYFGPFSIKEGRKQLKKYGVIFTCLVSRAIHIETANSLETTSFINALRRFIARRGNVRFMRSDNGTNFHGAERELRQAIAEMDNDQIQAFLLHGSIDWTFNPPAASHMGGIWERQIRTVRKVLSGLVRENGERLDDESFRTLMWEIEAIINSRPITTVSSSPDDLNPLTPNHILTMKTGIICAPPGQFQRDDIYMRQRWRRVQYLANLFWTRWKKEYLMTLQERQKWNTPKRNMEIGDLVLIKDDNLPRNTWSMSRFCKKEVDRKGFVRSVVLKTQTTELRRPVNKLVLILAKEEQIDA